MERKGLFAAQVLLMMSAVLLVAVRAGTTSGAGGHIFKRSLSLDLRQTECSQDEMQEYLKDLSEECIQASISLDPTSTDDEHIESWETVCSSECLVPLYTYTYNCFSKELAKLFDQLCGNYKGEKCYSFAFDSSSINFNQTYLDCVVGNGEGSCSSDCKTDLSSAKSKLGCCFNNIYNNTFTADIGLADSSLWESCELSRPSFCESSVDGASVTFASVPTVALGILFCLFITLATK